MRSRAIAHSPRLDPCAPQGLLPSQAPSAVRPGLESANSAKMKIPKPNPDQIGLAIMSM
jgi:hypothetical protein